MSAYIVIGDGDPIEVASNTGWSGFCGWIDGLDADAYEPLVHFREHGWVEPLSELKAALAAALRAEPPGDENVSHVVRTFAELIGDEPDDEIVCASNGMVRDDESGADAGPKA